MMRLKVIKKNRILLNENLQNKEYFFEDIYNKYESLYYEFDKIKKENEELKKENKNIKKEIEKIKNGIRDLIKMYYDDIIELKQSGIPKMNIMHQHINPMMMNNYNFMNNMNPMMMHNYNFMNNINPINNFQQKINVFFQKNLRKIEINCLKNELVSKLIQMFFDKMNIPVYEQYSFSFIFNEKQLSIEDELSIDQVNIKDQSIISVMKEYNKNNIPFNCVYFIIKTHPMTSYTSFPLLILFNESELISSLIKRYFIL